LILTCYTYSRAWDNEIVLRETQRIVKEKEAALQKKNAELQEKEAVLKENAQQMARDREIIAALQAQLIQRSGP
jgi:Skp family chaperone for outer membrane proteins